ncbi:enoyl-CoA hydratase/isomerase family protein [Sphingobium sp. EM0848]|uniref:enoyl-CoA hydratase/isomerase family protein n=1 Tax=Sphingobium sp. EM0848 TaxID=2743473 RepID=UPI00159C01F7|nr:enoyl-CoA hydratase/isomerase family protein [Sphingobium sp. EM0848]
MESGQMEVRTSRQGAVAIIAYHNPPSGLIPNKGAILLADALRAVLDDPDVRAVVLTGGQEGVFIRHADVSQIVRAAQALQAGAIAPESFVDAPFPRLGRLIETAEKPVIAAIDGVCMGGGFEIALCCMTRIAGAGVTAIGLPEIRIGIFPGSGGTQRLPRLIGGHRARRFMLDGAVVDAAVALELGLVDEVVPSALDRAIEIAEGYAARSLQAVAAILRLTRDNPPAERLQAELVTFAELLRADGAATDIMCRFVAEGGALHDMP